MRNRPHALSVLFAAALLIPALAPAQQPPKNKLGIFEGSTDIGETRPGATLYDPATTSFRVTGGGADLWGAADQFHLTWLKLSGDAALSADIHFAPGAADPTAKAILIFRQSLDPASPYADAAIHADGHITLQYRATPGGKTEDSTAPQHGPARLRIERRGNQFTLYIGSPNSKTPATPPATVVLHDPVYVGIGVCAHNADHLETATFTNVTLDHSAPPAPTATHR